MHRKQQTFSLVTHISLDETLSLVQLSHTADLCKVAHMVYRAILVNTDRPSQMLNTVLELKSNNAVKLYNTTAFLCQSCHGSIGHNM